MEHIEVQKSCECIECLVRENIYPLCIATFALLLFIVIFTIANLIIFNRGLENDNK